jgi:hypothetical protein
MHVLLVQVADLRGKAARAGLQAVGQAGGFDEDLFKALFQLAIVRFEHGADMAAQMTPKRTRRGEVAMAELQPLVAHASRQRPGGVREVEHAAEFPSLVSLGKAGGAEQQRRGAE